MMGDYDKALTPDQFQNPGLQKVKRGMVGEDATKVGRGEVIEIVTHPAKSYVAMLPGKENLLKNFQKGDDKACLCCGKTTVAGENESRKAGC